MTRQRRLKRRIRARMAKTGESYATARREVLKRLGAVERPAPSSPGAPGTEGRLPRRRTRIGAVGLVLAVAAAAVVVIWGTGEGPEQPPPADELPPGLRVQLERDIDLDQVRSVECRGGPRTPVDPRWDRFDAGPACRIEVGGSADIIAFKGSGEFQSLLERRAGVSRDDEWHILRAVSAPRLRRMASVALKNRSSKRIERLEADVRKLHPEFEGTAAPLSRRAAASYGEVYSVIR